MKHSCHQNLARFTGSYNFARFIFTYYFLPPNPPKKCGQTFNRKLQIKGPKLPVRPTRTISSAGNNVAVSSVRPRSNPRNLPFAWANTKRILRTRRPCHRRREITAAINALPQEIMQVRKNVLATSAASAVCICAVLVNLSAEPSCADLQWE